MVQQLIAGGGKTNNKYKKNNILGQLVLKGDPLMVMSMNVL